MLRQASEQVGVAVLGTTLLFTELELPTRHLCHETIAEYERHAYVAVEEMTVLVAVFAAARCWAADRRQGCWAWC
nr:hypothetical protein [Mycobacterium leprae]